MADCLTVDCGRAPAPPARAPRVYDGVEPQAKDYDSLLRAMFDLLSQRAPEWRDRNESDPGIVLLELFAYAGDQLSWLQDRVALEGTLRTATQFESVRKLLQLVGYTMDAGQAGAADLVFELQGASALFLPAGFAVRTVARDGEQALVYETAVDAVLHPAASRIALAADAPSSADGRQAQCAADLTGAVGPGDRLLLQHGSQREWAEVASAVYGPVSTLTFAEPLAARYSAGGATPALAYGNVVVATHGCSVVETATGDGTARQRVALELAPLTQLPEENSAVGPGATTQPVLTVRVDRADWLAVDDFIDSAAADRHYRLSRDNDGQVTLHFGDGSSGAAPPPGARIDLRYRVGNGLAGQVAADALVVFDDPAQRIVAVRNPMPATGARDPQTLAQARLLGPDSLRRQDRAVLPADYEAVLAAGVQIGARRIVPLQSRARTRDTGSWSTVFVSVDLPDRQPLAATPGLRAAFEALLDARRMAGVDVRVEDARYCPLHIALQVDVGDAHFARDVRAAVEAALLGPVAADQPLPLFAPGRLRFGQAVALSDVYGAASAVEGVRSVTVTRFKRLGDRYADAEAAGAIAVGALEVARLDNDAADTSNGLLFVRTCGGKEG